VDKDSSRITAGELLRLVESWGQKALKKRSNSTYIPTSCSGGFSRKIFLASVVRYDWNFHNELSPPFSIVLLK